MRKKGASMHFMACLTRVVTDDDCCVEVAQLQAALHTIQRALKDVPSSERHYIAEALLSFAVERTRRDQTVASTRALRPGVSNAPWRP